ncbi:hypothetical protein, partial [Futiania mangrovi]
MDGEPVLVAQALTGPELADEFRAASKVEVPLLDAGVNPRANAGSWNPIPDWLGTRSQVGNAEIPAAWARAHGLEVGVDGTVNLPNNAEGGKALARMNWAEWG